MRPRFAVDGSCRCAPTASRSRRTRTQRANAPSVQHMRRASRGESHDQLPARTIGHFAKLRARVKQHFCECAILWNRDDLFARYSGRGIDKNCIARCARSIDDREDRERDARSQVALRRQCASTDADQRVASRSSQLCFVSLVAYPHRLHRRRVAAYGRITRRSRVAAFAASRDRSHDSPAASFDKLRVASFESRRADETARMIERFGGVAARQPLDARSAGRGRSLGRRLRPPADHRPDRRRDPAHRRRHARDARPRRAARRSAAISRRAGRREDDRPRAEAAGRAEGTGPHADGRRARAEHLARGAGRRSTPSCRWPIRRSPCRSTACRT